MKHKVQHYWVQNVKKIDLQRRYYFMIPLQKRSRENFSEIAKIINCFIAYLLTGLNFFFFKAMWAKQAKSGNHKAMKR